MSTVVLEGSSSVVPTETAYEFIISSKEPSITVETNNEVFISSQSVEYVLVEKSSSTLVLAGGLGPQGAPGIPEEDIMYSKRIDFITDNELYKGEAAVGTLENTASWRIRKVVIGIDNDITETWAGGNANFDKIWANRNSLSYS